MQTHWTALKLATLAAGLALFVSTQREPDHLSVTLICGESGWLEAISIDGERIESNRWGGIRGIDDPRPIGAPLHPEVVRREIDLSLRSWPKWAQPAVHFRIDDDLPWHQAEWVIDIVHNQTNADQEVLLMNHRDEAPLAVLKPATSSVDGKNGKNEVSFRTELSVTFSSIKHALRSKPNRCWTTDEIYVAGLKEEGLDELSQETMLTLDWSELMVPPSKLGRP